LRSQEEVDQDVDRNQIEELIQSQTPAVYLREIAEPIHLASYNH